MKKIIQKKYQKAMLLILKEINKYCVREELEYFIIGGTLLGSFRHGGFIPWDIDIDIAMTRKNYEKFLANFNNEKNNILKAISYKSEKKYFSPHAKIILKDSKVIYSNKTKRSENIFIDLFPLDFVPRNNFEQKKQANKIRNLRKIISFKKGIIHDKGFLYSKFIIKKAFKIFLSIFNLYKLNRKLDYLMTNNQNENDQYICSKASKYNYFKQLMPITNYRPAKIVSFENLKVYGPNKPNEYLKKIYGPDYMKYPPYAEREIQLNKIQNVIFPRFL